MTRAFSIIATLMLLYMVIKMVMAFVEGDDDTGFAWFHACCWCGVSMFMYAHP